MRTCCVILSLVIIHCCHLHLHPVLFHSSAWEIEKGSSSVKPNKKHQVYKKLRNMRSFPKLCKKSSPFLSCEREKGTIWKIKVESVTSVFICQVEMLKMLDIISVPCWRKFYKQCFQFEVYRDVSHVSFIVGSRRPKCAKSRTVNVWLWSEFSAYSHLAFITCGLKSSRNIYRVSETKTVERERFLLLEALATRKCRKAIPCLKTESSFPLQIFQPCPASI